MMLEELKIKTETYYALQKLRIQAQLRIKAFVRDDRLNEVRAGTLHFWLDEHLLKTEDALKKEISTLLKDIPIWSEWLKDVKGIGPCLAGSLYAGIYDISRFFYISALWSYCGMGVVGGEAPRRQKKQKINWSPFLRMTMFKVTDSFIKQDPEKCLYRRLYTEKKPTIKINFQSIRFAQNVGRFCWSGLAGLINAQRKAVKVPGAVLCTLQEKQLRVNRFIFIPKTIFTKWPSGMLEKSFCSTCGLNGARLRAFR